MPPSNTLCGAINMPLFKSLARTLLVIAISVTLLSTSAVAENTKELPLARIGLIGVVDIQKALRLIPAGKRIKSKLEKEVKSKQKLLDKKQNALKKMKTDLEKQSGLMQDSVKRQKFREYQQRMLELQEAYVKHQTALKKKEAKLLKPVLEKLEKVIIQVAKSEGFTVILEMNESRVIYALPALEITDLVVKRYGK
jgi:outer membrane protein